MPKVSSYLNSIISWVNKHGNFNPLLKSQIVLYFLFLVSLANLYTFVSTGNGTYAAIFLLVGFLTTFFSKNMVVIMILALAVSNILFYGRQIALEEGFEGGETGEDDMMDQSAKLNTELESNEEPESESEPEPESNMQEKPKKMEKKLESMISDRATDATTKPPTKTTTKTTKPQPTATQVESAKADLKGLLELEVKLMQGVTEMQPLLDKAKQIVGQLKENVKSTSSPSA